MFFSLLMYYVFNYLLIDFKYKLLYIWKLLKAFDSNELLNTFRMLNGWSLGSIGRGLFATHITLLYSWDRLKPPGLQNMTAGKCGRPDQSHPTQWQEDFNRTPLDCSADETFDQMNLPLIWIWQKRSMLNTKTFSSPVTPGSTPPRPKSTSLLAPQTHSHLIN